MPRAGSATATPASSVSWSSPPGPGTVVEVGLAVHGLQPGQQLGPFGATPVTAEPIIAFRRAVVIDPPSGGRAGRRAATLKGLLDGLLHRVLGQLDVARPTAEDGHRPRPVGAVGGRDLFIHIEDRRRRVHRMASLKSIHGRTLTAP